MPISVLQIPSAHVADMLDYGFGFDGFGTGDDVGTFVITAPAAVTASAGSSAGQTVTVRLGPATAGTHRIIVAATSVAGQEATIEADWTVADPL